MTSITIFSAAGNHNHYGPTLLVTAVASNREAAISKVIDQMAGIVQERDKAILMREKNRILEIMRTRDNLLDPDNITEEFPDDYIDIIVAKHTVPIRFGPIN